MTVIAFLANKLRKLMLDLLALAFHMNKSINLTGRFCMPYSYDGESPLVTGIPIYGLI